MSNQSTSKPMYEQIFDALREDITSLKYKPGDRIPSEKELCEQFNVSRITSKKALELLTAEGYIIRKPGKGSFVSESMSVREGVDPSNAALSLTTNQRIKRQKKMLIGLVITNFDDSYGTELVYGMEEASREHDSYLIIRRSFGIAAREEEAISQLLAIGVDGLIIFPAQGEYFSAEILKLVISKFPFVLVDRYLKGISASSISSDNLQAAKEATNYLFELGHTQISFLTQPSINTTAIEERIEGFIQAHAEKGIVADRGLWLENITSTLPNEFDPNTRERDIEIIQQHLKQHPEITALFTVEYTIAQYAFEAARRLGLSVPDDISIICFDSPRNDSYQFTHIRQNQLEIGKRAIESVLKLHNQEQVAGRVMLHAPLVIGKTTAAPKVKPV
ncbi:GntR family transcriptional regulator [Paenibacillus sanguinis]|uniref:GntR family transcriptional regulator n=1 Tax=Paenibacillus sanguinis TaxID=225906 RepID=UPI00039988E3|nr:GntR family transcriptional regulator [Paenibacillus sanguinis]